MPNHVLVELLPALHRNYRCTRQNVFLMLIDLTSCIARYILHVMNHHTMTDFNTRKKNMKYIIQEVLLPLVKYIIYMYFRITRVKL